MSELVDRLDMARRVVEAGWTKNKMHNPERTHFCALGALDLVCTGVGVDVFIRSALLLGDVIHEQFPDRVMRGNRCDSGSCACQRIHLQDTIAPFNDHDDTTKDEVLAMFEKAIVRAEEAI